MSSESYDAEVVEVRAQIAAMPGAKPCPVCAMATPDVRRSPPCYQPYVGRNPNCPVFRDTPEETQEQDAMVEAPIEFSGIPAPPRQRGASTSKKG